MRRSRKLLLVVIERISRMNWKFTFTITKQEYLQYLRYQINSMKSYRGYKFWIRTSIPALLVCSTLFFHLYLKIWWDIIGIILLLWWIFIGTGIIWRVFLGHRIQEKIIEDMNIKGFKEISVQFLNDRIQYQDSTLHAIKYQEIHNCIPLKMMFLFLYQDNKVLLLPYRVFTNEEHMKAFLCYFDKAWMRIRRGVEKL